MKKNISVRRQKRTRGFSMSLNPATGNELSQDRASQSASDLDLATQAVHAHFNRDVTFESKQHTVLLEKVKFLQLEQQSSQSILVALEKRQLTLQQQLLTLNTSLSALQQNQSAVLAQIQTLSSKLSALTVLPELYNEVKALKNSSRDDYSTLFNIISNQKQDQDIERTLSFQLGKVLIDGGKNVNNIISLPKKLMELHREGLRRKEKNTEIESAVVHRQHFQQVYSETPSKLSIAARPIRKIGLEQIFQQSKMDHFDGNLLNYLQMRNHELVEFTRNQDGIMLSSRVELDKPRYFYSNNMLHLEGLQDYIESNKLTVLLQYQQDGFNVELMIHYLNEAKEKISFSIAKPSAKIFLNIPDECKFLHIGFKLSGHGQFLIKYLRLLGTEQVQQGIESRTQLTAGISIIVPSYQGDATILDTLDSIQKQKNIQLDLIEVVCVINGPQEKTAHVLQVFTEAHPNFNLKILYSPIASASHARNLGLEHASREYLVFLDDDDIISENYLCEMYTLVEQNTVVFSYIHDLNEQGQILKETSITQQLVKNQNNLTLNGLSSAITMIASKMLPTADVRQIKFDPQLKSGEDVSFFVEYMVKFNPKFKLVADTNCAYIRRMTENSVSRQPMSFHFNVEQRLDVIKSLDTINSRYPELLEGFIISKMKAQIGFIARYLTEHPDDLDQIITEVIQRKISHFPYKYFWEKVGKNQVQQLIFSYCHPPFVDTSATIVGKRVQEFGLYSDVIANDMSNLRKVDRDMMFLNCHLIHDIHFLQTPTSFGGWKAIKEFSEQANLLVDRKFYQQVYSRVLWPGSNFAALIYKLNQPQTKWVAEFSDPAVLDIKGEERKSLFDDPEWKAQILAYIPLHLRNLPANEDNLYVWCELVAYLFADEIIFTCENQRQVMLDHFKYKEIAQLAYSKSVIKQHPTLPPVFYQLGQSQYEVDHNFINIGYFGVFYENRNLNDFITAINQVNQLEHVKRKIKLHIFTNTPQDFAGKYGEYTIFNAYLGYFDFLTTSNDFDYLLVNDAVVSNIFGINPYLPSKVSDYKGAQAQIIALVESGSALSKMESIPIKLFLGSEHSFSTKLLDLIDSEVI